MKMKELLDEAVARYNTPSFIDCDPVQFPHRFAKQQDIEITSLIVGHIAWGKRTMILRDSERLLKLMEGRPAEWIMERGYDYIDDEQNIHRTFFARDLKYMCNGLRTVYREHGTLESFGRHLGIDRQEQPAWALAQALNEVGRQSNGGQTNSRCLPQNIQTTALKRLNMTLRWLVRNDGIVDLGVWKLLNPKQLYIPLDVHVARTARTLGLIERTTNTRRTVVELTDALRQYDADDPCKYDFALFGLGVNSVKSLQE